MRRATKCQNDLMTRSDAGTEPVYYVVEMTVPYASLAEVQAEAPEALAEHIERSAELHRAGDLLMAGAFLEPDAEDGHLRTMAVCRSRAAAERFVAGDPFVRNGTVLTHRVRAWANMFAR
jgi:uncharacterized protein YciI